VGNSENLDHVELQDEGQIQELYKTMKNGFECDYEDPFEDDPDFTTKLAENRVIHKSALNRTKVAPEDAESDVQEPDCFQEFVNVTIQNQAQNMTRFFRTFRVPQEYYQPIRNVVQEFRTIIPMYYTDHCRLPIQHQNSHTRIRRIRYLKRIPTNPYPETQMIVSARNDWIHHHQDSEFYPPDPETANGYLFPEFGHEHPISPMQRSLAISDMDQQHRDSVRIRRVIRLHNHPRNFRFQPHQCNDHQEYGQNVYSQYDYPTQEFTSTNDRIYRDQFNEYENNFYEENGQDYPATWEYLAGDQSPPKAKLLPYHSSILDSDGPKKAQIEPAPADFRLNESEVDDLLL
jgi:hypothetical protein